MLHDDWTIKPKFSVGGYLVLVARPESSKYSESYRIEEVTPTSIIVELSNGQLLCLQKTIDHLGLESVTVKEAVTCSGKCSISRISIKGLPFERKVQQHSIQLAA